MADLALSGQVVLRRQHVAPFGGGQAILSVPSPASAQIAPMDINSIWSMSWSSAGGIDPA
jgi:hypothetical protein